jgi:hypothetical protein
MTIKRKGRYAAHKRIKNKSPLSFGQPGAEDTICAGEGRQKSFPA